MKNDLRKKYKQLRKGIQSKKELDTAICMNFLQSDLYKNADAVLCYSSLPDEISTDLIINQALSDGKILALPVCTDSNGNMNFYIINSPDELALGSFSVMEPNKDICVPFGTSLSPVCVVPALCFDKKGYRIGYGKGYYDKFLKKFTSVSVGLCYNGFIEDNLPCDEFDEKVDFIITQSNILNCKGG